MDIKNLTPEQLYTLLKALEDQAMDRIDALYSEFSKEIAGMGLVKSYISNKEQKLLSEMKRLSESIENKVYQLLDNIYAINNTSFEQAWKIGEKYTESTLQGLLKNKTKLFESLRKSGVFEHRQKSMEAFKVNKKNFDISTRVWREEIKSQIEGALQLGLSKGQSSNQLSKDIREFLIEPDKLFRRIKDKDTGEFKLSKAAREYHPGQGVYRSSYMNAKRLVSTEINRSYRTAEQESYHKNPCIIGFRIRLSNNHTLINPKTRKPEPFVDICDYAQGLYPKDFVWTGWHPFCRCIMTPVFASEEDIDAMTQAILDGKSPDTIQPRQITTIPKKFIDWSQKHKKQISGWESLPYYVKNNPDYAQKYFVYKDIFKDNRGFYSLKTFENGGNVKIHELTSRKTTDYKDILSVSTEFARMGKKVEILPNVHFKSDEYAAIFGSLEDTPYYRKCPDIKVGTRYYEYETFRPPFKKRKISNMISHGAKQSSCIIIDNNKGSSDRYIRRTILDRLKDKNFRYDIEEVWLYEKGKLRLFFKKQ